MDQPELFPCSQMQPMVHMVMVVFAGMNMLLTTWLTVRAHNKDKKEDRNNHKESK